MEPQITLLTRMLTAHSPHWEITHDEIAGVWIAWTKPTPTSEHFICAHSLDVLERRLDAIAEKELTEKEERI
jgi:hypothetical protein